MAEPVVLPGTGATVVRAKALGVKVDCDETPAEGKGLDSGPDTASIRSVVLDCTNDAEP
jgi:hypothetical protein